MYNTDIEEMRQTNKEVEELIRQEAELRNQLDAQYDLVLQFNGVDWTTVKGNRQMSQGFTVARETLTPVQGEKVSISVIRRQGFKDAKTVEITNEYEVVMIRGSRVYLNFVL